MRNVLSMGMWTINQTSDINHVVHRIERCFVSYRSLGVRGKRAAELLGKGGFGGFLTPWLMRKALSTLNFTCLEFILGQLENLNLSDSECVSLWSLDMVLLLTLEGNWKVEEDEERLITRVSSCSPSFFFLAYLEFCLNHGFFNLITLDALDCIILYCGGFRVRFKMSSSLPILYLLDSSSRSSLMPLPMWQPKWPPG